MAERIVIEGSRVELSGGDGVRHVADVEPWIREMNQRSVRGLTEEPIPDNVKWIVSCGSVDICIVEFKPELRCIKWISKDSPAPFGPEATAAERRLATPYVILKVPFRRGRVIGRVEVFYRNEPLRKLSAPGGALYWPNLLNVSPHHNGCTAWFCTQFFDAASIRPGIAEGLQAVSHHLWGGQYNLSSEFHEGRSTFSKAQQDAVDPRVTDVDRWEAESVKDPRFVLSIDWRPTNMDVAKVIGLELRLARVQAVPATASALGSCLLRAEARSNTTKSH